MKTMSPLPSCVRALLNDAQRAAIFDAPLVAQGKHPTWHPVFSSQPRSVDVLSNRAVARISKEPEGLSWLEALSRRLADTSNREDAAAALAELRAYGSLLEANFSVKPKKPKTVPTPEFMVDAGDGEVVVEVFAKHQDDDQKLLVDTGAGNYSPCADDVIVVNSGQVEITMETRVLHPGGTPDPKKPHDSIQA